LTKIEERRALRSRLYATDPEYRARTDQKEREEAAQRKVKRDARRQHSAKDEHAALIARTFA
jgi:hypothetical protein